MVKQIAATRQPLPLADIAEYQRDAEASLRLYFTPRNPDFIVLFAIDLPSEVKAKLDGRLNETDMRSALALMACIEAAFRIDYQRRCNGKQSDPVSIECRKLFRRRGWKPRLEDELWEVWSQNYLPAKQIISQLRSVFKFRHWLAHGRYWQPGNKYDFQVVYLLAVGVFATFPLYL